MPQTTKYELVTVEHDGGNLHGIVTGSGDKLAIHVHGTWGNFYGNHFVGELAQTYVDRGYRYAALNFPGHDETAISERFEQFPPALSAWLNRLNAPDQFLLQGHSLGALKALYAMRTANHIAERVAALVLLAPFDVVEFYVRESGVDANELRDAATNLVQIDGPEARVPKYMSPYWDLSAQTLLDATTRGGDWDQFPSALGRVGSLGDSLPPVFFAIGSEDFAAVPTVAEVFSLGSSAPSVTGSHLSAGAPHNFAGGEAGLVAKVADWLDTL